MDLNLDIVLSGSDQATATIYISANWDIHCMSYKTSELQMLKTSISVNHSEEKTIRKQFSNFTMSFKIFFFLNGEVTFIYITHCSCGLSQFLSHSYFY